MADLIVGSALDAWSDDFVHEGKSRWGTGVCWDYCEHGKCDFSHYGDHPTVTVMSSGEVTLSHSVPQWKYNLKLLGFRPAGSAASSSTSTASASQVSPGTTIITFGKHNGKTFAEVAKSDPGYAKWVLSVSDPSAQLANFATFLKAQGKRAPALSWELVSASGVVETSGEAVVHKLLSYFSANHLRSTDSEAKRVIQYHAALAAQLEAARFEILSMLCDRCHDPIPDSGDDDDYDSFCKCRECEECCCRVPRDEGFETRHGFFCENCLECSDEEDDGDSEDDDDDEEEEQDDEEGDDDCEDDQVPPPSKRAKT